MNRKLTAASAVAAALLWGGSALAAPSLDVNGDAALNDTNFGLEVTLDGNDGQAYVQDNSPAGEVTYRARFYLDVNDLDVTDDSRQLHIVFAALPAGGQGRQVLRVYLLNEGNNDKWRVRVFCRPNTGEGNFAKSGSITVPGSPDNERAEQFEVTYQAATNDSSADGSCSIQRLSGNMQIKEITGLQNDATDIRRVRLGAISSIDPVTVGSYYLDEFESFR